MKNFVQAGDHIEFTAAAAVNAGDVVLVGSILGVAQGDVANGEKGTLLRKGVFTLPKAAQAWTHGQKLYWDSGNSNFSTTASGNTLAGFANGVAASGDATGPVLLTGQAV